MNAAAPRVLSIALLALTACGGRTLEAPPAERLPPNDVAALAEIFDPELEPLGLRLVRGSLIDRSEGGYERSASGTHLALYAEPFGTYTTDRFVSNIIPLTAVFTPEVFERWPGLESFDVCQEPLPFVDDRPAPAPVSQVTIRRGPASDLDWDEMDLPGLISAAKRLPEDIDLVLSPVLRRSPRLRPLLSR